MKKRKFLLLALCALFASCGLFDHDVHITVSEDQLYGCWVVDGTQEYWRYNTDGTGVTWDESDDVSEEESNSTFSWGVREDELTHIFTGRMGNQAVPKIKVIKSISETSMQWEGDFGTPVNLTKTNR